MLDKINVEVDSVRFDYAPLPNGWSLANSQASSQIRMQGFPGDHIFEQVRRDGSFYERRLLEYVGLMIDTPAVFIDIGANIGNHSIFFAKVLGGKVVCVEPNPAAADLLEKNIFSNNVGHQVHIARVAATDKKCSLQLLPGPLSNLGTTRVTDQISQGSKMIVPGECVDDIVSSIAFACAGNISLIKIDVEGSEERVLQGARKTIDRHRPMIIVEPGSHETHKQIDRLLHPLGYHKLGPLCATPTYIYSQSRCSCLTTPLQWQLRRGLRRIMRHR
ncbi:MAG TPA: FkbM family methyltransferase [Clostridia bacterium]|nr:FkbM family methyltransferase [Clostridia bacterium]